MLVDSSALAEQVVGDVVASAFDSAGQRCSALRVLCLQDDGADRIARDAARRDGREPASARRSARRRRRPGDRRRCACRDRSATSRRCEQRGRRVFQAARDVHGDDSTAAPSSLPTLIELDRIDELEREVFGPVLHVVRYRRRDLAETDRRSQRHRLRPDARRAVAHRRDDRAGRRRARTSATSTSTATWSARSSASSRSAAKACPAPARRRAVRSTCMRLLARRPADAMARALDGGAGVDDGVACGRLSAALRELQRWAERAANRALAEVCERFAQTSRVGVAALLPGPTGERNVYTLHPRDAVLCLADARERSPGPARRRARRRQPRALADRRGGAAHALPKSVRARIELVADWTAPAVRFDAVLHHGRRGRSAAGRRARLPSAPDRSSASRDCGPARRRCRSNGWWSSARSASTPRRRAATRR